MTESLALECLHDPTAIAEVLARDPDLRFYELGDLDTAYFRRTTWWGLVESAGRIRELILLYAAGSLPVLLALARPGTGAADMVALLRALLPYLPRRFYSHLGPGLSDELSHHFRARPQGSYVKMVLEDRAAALNVDASAAERMTRKDLPEIEALYKEAYPGAWFDPTTFDMVPSFGVRAKGKLVGIAGLHVYSAEQRVAALGNVTTHPEHRGRGIARIACAALCQHLAPTTDRIGLNVSADNAPAIACYQRLGFALSGQYEEWMFETNV